jgi:hypothetical protein
MMNASVTVLRPKDRTAAERSKRYRRKRKVVTAATAQNSVTVTTVEMCALAGRLGAGRVTAEDLRVAERLILALVHRLPADSTLDVL